MNTPTRIKTRVTETVISLTLTEEEVLDILAEWAARTHDMQNARVDLDIGYGGFLRGATISVTKVQTEHL